MNPFKFFNLKKAPYTFLTLIKAVCPTCINNNVYEFAFWLLWLNSTVNPILYPFLHVKFRKAFIKIFKLIFFCIKFKRKKYNPNKKWSNIILQHSNIDFYISSYIYRKWPEIRSQFIFTDKQLAIFCQINSFKRMLGVEFYFKSIGDNFEVAGVLF